jgi:hypothetical protein
MVTTAISNSKPQTTATNSNARTNRRAGLWRAGAIAGVAAAVATTLIVVVARAADVSVAVQGERIPLAGFAELTLVGAVIGVVLAKSFARWASQPQRTFVRGTVALTALSLVPDALADAATATKLVLMLTHVVAASIVIPRLAARLHR